jgi:hypothetical protein
MRGFFSNGTGGMRPAALHTRLLRTNLLNVDYVVYWLSLGPMNP